MKRALSVVLVALLTAAVSGIDESWADQTRTAEQAEAHRQQIAGTLQSLPIGSALEIQPERGKKFQALLESVTSDEVTVRLVSGRYSVSRTIRLDEIRNVRGIGSLSRGGHTTRNILIGVGVGVAVTVGVCAASLSGYDSSKHESTADPAEGH